MGEKRKMKKHVFVSIMTFLVLILVTACQQTENGEQENNKNITHQLTDTSFPVQVMDAANNKIIIDEKPERIISLIPSNTEIAYALELGNSIIAVTDNDSYPADVKNKEVIGGFQLNFEKIIALKPDLVLAHGLNGDLEQLRSAGITVLVVNNFESSFHDVFDSISLIATATGTVEKGNEIINEMTGKIDEIKKKSTLISNKKRVWIEIDPLLYTTGQGTFLQEMLNIINAENIAGNAQGWPQFSEEVVIDNNPDVIIATYENAVDKITSRKAWSEINAIKSGATYEVNGDLVSRGGPRLIKGVEMLAKLIYPTIY
jgi:iron complex transport system substrate-binding protein